MHPWSIPHCIRSIFSTAVCRYVGVMKALRARLGVARMLLANADSDSRTAVSSVQARATLDLLERHKDDLNEIEDKANLMEIVLQSGFEPTDTTALNSALASSCFKLCNRRKQQDYSAMYDFFSAADWKVLSNPAVNQNTKIATVAARGIALGCRCPTEHTFKAWASMIMALEGQESYVMSSPGDKQKHLEFLKEEFRRFGRRAGKPILWLQKLPAVPSDLPPGLYAQAFADGDPVVCKMPSLIAEANKIDMSFGCRSGRLDLGSTVATLNLSPAGGSQVQDIACVMMQGMQQMVQQQSQMMNFMMGGGPSTLALNNVRGMMSRQMSFGAARPMLHFGEVADEQALPPRDLETTPRPLATPPPPPVATPLMLALPPPPTMPPTVGQAVNPNTLDLLKMLDEREEGKKQAKKEAAKEAKAELKKTDESATVAMKRPAAAVKSSPRSCEKGAKRLATVEVAEATPEQVNKKATYGIEWSRSRIQCRTMKSGAGQNFSIRFGDGAECKTVDDARKKADAWLKSELRSRG